MKKLLIIGNFGGKNKNINGQVIKTNILYDYLKKENIFNKIVTVNTNKWKYKSIFIIFETIIKYLYTDKVIILISRNGMKIFFPILYYLKKVKLNNIYHIVIGSGLYDLIKNNKSMIKYLRIIDGNYIETQTSIKELENIGFSNTYFLNNFKDLKISKYKKNQQYL